MLLQFHYNEVSGLEENLPTRTISPWRRLRVASVSDFGNPRALPGRAASKGEAAKSSRPVSLSPVPGATGGAAHLLPPCSFAATQSGLLLSRACVPACHWPASANPFSLHARLASLLRPLGHSRCSNAPSHRLVRSLFAFVARMRCAMSGYVPRASGWLRHLPPLLRGVYEMSTGRLIRAHASFWFSFASFCLYASQTSCYGDVFK